MVVAYWQKEKKRREHLENFVAGLAIICGSSSKTGAREIVVEVDREGGTFHAMRRDHKPYFTEEEDAELKRLGWKWGMYVNSHEPSGHYFEIDTDLCPDLRNTLKKAPETASESSKT